MTGFGHNLVSVTSELPTGDTEAWQPIERDLANMAWTEAERRVLIEVAVAGFQMVKAD